MPAMRILARRWNGAAWEGLGDLGRGPRPGAYPSIAADARDRVVVAWTPRDAKHEYAYLKRWTGDAWEELEGSASGDGLFGPGRGSVGLALDPEGNPVVTWAGLRDVQIKRWTGRTWTELPSRGSGSTWPSASARPAFDRTGRLFVAFLVAFPTGSRIVVRRWDGRTWSDVADAPASGDSTEAGHPCMTVDDEGRPVVAWHEPSRMVVRRLSRAP
jgi:hypothetical protein